MAKATVLFQTAAIDTLKCGPKLDPPRLPFRSEASDWRTVGGKVDNSVLRAKQLPPTVRQHLQKESKASQDLVKELSGGKAKGQRGEGPHVL